MRKPGGEDELDDRGDDQEDLVGQDGDRHEMLVRVKWGWPGRKSRKNGSIVKSRLVELK